MFRYRGAQIEQLPVDAVEEAKACSTILGQEKYIVEEVYQDQQKRDNEEIDSKSESY